MDTLEIRHITDPETLATILTMDDAGLDYGVLSNITCTKAEWVQYLMTKVDSLGPDFFRVYGILKDNKLIAYAVAQNAMDIPMSRDFVIRYLTLMNIEPEKREHYGNEILKRIEDWAAEHGSNGILIVAKDEEMARVYEIKAKFKIIPSFVMRKTL